MKTRQGVTTHSLAASVGKPKPLPHQKGAVARAAARAEAKAEELALFAEKKDTERPTALRAVAAAKAVVNNEENRRHLVVEKAVAVEKGPNSMRLPAPNSPKCIATFTTSLATVNSVISVV